jgi:hypothetical protein
MFKVESGTENYSDTSRLPSARQKGQTPGRAEGRDEPAVTAKRIASSAASRSPTAT